MDLKILVLCTGNSCRSQMAQGYLMQMLDGKAKVYSAGVETHGVNPRAIQIMQEDEVDISHHTSNHIDEYDNLSFEYVITVCDHAKERCPFFPAQVKQLHHNFPDPAKATGTEAEIIASFRNTRNLIRSYCQEFTKQILN